MAITGASSDIGNKADEAGVLGNMGILAMATWHLVSGRRSATTKRVRILGTPLAAVEPGFTQQPLRESYPQARHRCSKAISQAGSMVNDNVLKPLLYWLRGMFEYTRATLDRTRIRLI
jgi:hypothetical protein